MKNASTVKEADSMAIRYKPLSQFKILGKSFVVFVFAKNIMPDERGQIANSAVRS
jgi:hypothetical protein